MKRRQLLARLGGIGAAATFGSSTALAQAPSSATYPERPVRLVIPWPPGGGTDIFGRALGERLGQRWGQPVIVENRAGAAGNIGAAAVAQMHGDAHTLMLATITLATSPSLYKSLAYDPIKDLQPVTLVAGVPHVLVVHDSVPARNIKELIALAKARPGKLTYASAGVGSPFHLAAELFKSVAGVDIVHVPYKGGAPAVADVMGGQVDMTFANLVAVLPHMKSGKIRALGITGAHRSDTLPDLPTIAESGLPSYAFDSWFGFFTPAGVPARIVDRLNRDIVDVLKSKEIQERLAREGADVVGSDAETFARHLRDETDKWRKVIAGAGITAD
ncbi:MAG: Bug family tripartite tricarboxylate transporter substrate binding protein [Lautropia sp.]